MDQPKKHLTHQHAQEQQQAETQQTAQQTAGREFPTVEELLREDARHTPVPPDLSHRLAESIKHVPQEPSRSWWKRIFGGADV